MKLILLSLFSYFIGNISGSLLLVKLLYNQDIRHFGSGNAGMTNALRNFGKKIGIATFGIDFLKGIIAAFIGSYFFGEIGLMLAAIFVVIGHDWPMIFNFKGGKGIATSFGVLIVASPILALLMFLIFLVTVIFTRYVSLGSIISAITGIFVGLIFLIRGNTNFFWIFVVLACLTIYKHRDNIRRLLKNQENKLNLF